MKQYLTWKNLKIVAGIVLLLVLITVLSGGESLPEEASPDPVVKTVEVIPFGAWDPDASREILGTVESSTNVDILAEIPGTIASVPVSIGDTVSSGQILARYERRNDATQLGYENAFQNLNAARASAQNSVRSAEISLTTAEQSLRQIQATEGQSYSQSLDTLRTTARNAETTLSTAANWADRILHASDKFRFEIDPTRQMIGSNNSVQKQQAKNMLSRLLQDMQAFDVFPRESVLSEGTLLVFAEKRLAALQDIQKILRDLNALIHETPITSRFSAANRSTYQAEVEGQMAAVDAVVLSLETKIETAKTSTEGNELSVLAAQNKVENARAALELARANAASSVSAAENQLRLAQASQSDLSVRAPFAGTITAKAVQAATQVKAGALLFSLAGKNVEPKITATLSAEELQKLRNAPEKVQVRFPDGMLFPLPTVQVSGTIDPASQKMNVEFPLESLPDEALVGSFVRILVPLRNGVSNLVPISAVSFEPDGAEVLVVSPENTARRQKVETGRIISDAIEIRSGLQPGDQLVRFRKRVNAGEMVEIRNQ